MYVLFDLGSTPQLPTPANIQTQGDFYIPHGATPPGGFHSPSYLPPMPQLSNEISKIPPFDSFHMRTMPPSPLDQLSMKLSPSSVNLKSPHLNDSINSEESQKIHSTVDQSNSDNSEDEDIDVVKSAFQPIKPASVLLQEIQHPDSTVQDKEPVLKNQLKIPSSKKHITLSPKSPSATRIHASNTTKAVWRPY